MGLFGSSFGQQNPAGYMMNIGQPRQPMDAWQMAMQPTQQQAAQQFQQQYGYQTPGIGDEMRGMQSIGNMQPQQLPTDPRAAQATRPGFFGKGGMGGKLGMGVLGGIADGIAMHAGFRPGYSDGIDQQREYAQRLQELQAQRQQRMEEMQQRLSMKQDTPVALQRNIEYLKSLNPNMTDQDAFAIARQSMVRPITIGGDVYDPTQLGPQGNSAPSAGPQPGEVVDGYKFNGGDPSDPNSWSKI